MPGSVLRRRNYSPRISMAANAWGALRATLGLGKDYRASPVTPRGAMDDGMPGKMMERRAPDAPLWAATVRCPSSRARQYFPGVSIGRAHCSPTSDADAKAEARHVSRGLRLISTAARARLCSGGKPDHH